MQLSYSLKHYTSKLKFSRLTCWVYIVAWSKNYHEINSSKLISLYRTKLLALWVRSSWVDLRFVHKVTGEQKLIEERKLHQVCQGKSCLTVRSFPLDCCCCCSPTCSTVWVFAYQCVHLWHFLSSSSSLSLSLSSSSCFLFFAFCVSIFMCLVMYWWLFFRAWMSHLIRKLFLKCYLLRQFWFKGSKVVILDNWTTLEKLLNPNI